MSRVAYAPTDMASASMMGALSGWQYRHQSTRTARHVVIAQKLTPSNVSPGDVWIDLDTCTAHAFSNGCWIPWHWESNIRHPILSHLCLRLTDRYGFNWTQTDVKWPQKWGTRPPTTPGIIFIWLNALMAQQALRATSLAQKNARYNLKRRKTLRQDQR